MTARRAGSSARRTGEAAEPRIRGGPAPGATARPGILSSVRNALRLLSCFSANEPNLGVTELARRLGLGKSTVHRLLTTLAKEGFVEHNPATGRYRLGIKLFDLGAIVSAHLDLHEAVAMFIDELRNHTGETVHVAVLDGREVVYVERRESPHTLRLFSQIGHRNWAHSTSTGKVLLAHLPPHELHDLLPENLEAKTPYTITDRDRLKQELERARLRGYAENVNESEVGVASVGAPIRDATGKVIAAISVAGPILRFDGDAMRRFAGVVVQTADAISERMGWRPGRAGAGK